jgi:uncharacterized membrane protein YfhO
MLCIYLTIFLAASRFERFDLFRNSLLILIPLEMILINYPALNNRMVVTRTDISDGLLYNDEAAKTIDFINSRDKSFFRIHKGFSSSPATGRGLNDSMVQGYNGITVYGSFNHINMVNFMDSAGVIDKKYEARTRWLYGLESSPLLMKLLNVKYIVTNGDYSKYMEFGFSPALRKSDHIVLALRYPLPFGYTYSQRIDQDTYRSLPPEKRHIALMKYCILPHGITTSIPLVENPIGLEGNYSQSDMENDYARLLESSLNVASFGEGRISGTATAPNDRLMLFSMPYDTGWEAVVNGIPVKLLNVNGGLSGLPISKGMSKIELKYRTPFLYEGLTISIFSSMVYLVFCFQQWRNSTSRKIATIS